MATDGDARVQVWTVVQTSAELIPRFDARQHTITDIEALGVPSITAKATARYSASYHLSAQTWQQSGRFDHLLKNSASGWQVTAINTTPEWENQPLSALLDVSVN